MTDAFANVHGRLGMGMMRLPMVDGEILYEEGKKLVDAFMSAGFNYFDTAHGYQNELSERAVKECVASRYPRESFVLTDKLTDDYFKTEDDIRPLFYKQLEECGVEYFDFYLMHSQSASSYAYFRERRAYETALELKRVGKFLHFGISFHDRAEVLERILLDYPEIEVVQIQYNYIDFDDTAIESGKCLDMCRKYNKPAIIMEPVKGGLLAKLPEDAASVFAALEGGSAASYALRFASGAPGVRLTLSGMGTLDEIRDNAATLGSFRPLDEAELEAIGKVVSIIRSKSMIPCTACRYCVKGCPKDIAIPELFACMNTKKLFDNWNAGFYYNIRTANRGKASDCIKCGKCEKTCPQHLKIRELLAGVAEEFEKKAE